MFNESINQSYSKHWMIVINQRSFFMTMKFICTKCWLRREISNRRKKQIAMFSWWQKHVYEIRTQQRYAFQIVKIRNLHRRLIDEQRQTTNINNKFTINDHILQTIFDIDCYIYQIFVSIRYFSSRFFFHIQHTKFFSRRLFSKMFDKYKKWKFRYYEYKNARWNKLSHELHETFTTYEKKNYKH